MDTIEALIARYFAPLSRLPSAADITSFDLQDDAALWHIRRDMRLVMSADALVCGVHFLSGTPANYIAQKAIAVNISDLVAKGAQPLSCMMTLGLPRRHGSSWLADFAKGLRKALRRYGCNLAGGDLVRAPSIYVGLTMFGRRIAPGYSARTNMRIGDDVYVTGTIGDGWLGLADARAGRQSAPRRHYDIPRPPLAFGLAAARHMRAGCDVSDGLWLDATRLAQASGVGLRLAADTMPLSAAGRRFVAAKGDVRKLLCGGDDYQILFGAAPENRAVIERLAHTHRTKCTRIGHVQRGAGVQFCQNGQALRPPKRQGYMH